MMSSKDGEEGKDQLQTEDERILTPLKTGDEILQIIKKGAEFTQQLLKENEKLRYRVVKMEEENYSLKNKMTETCPPDERENLQSRIAALESERNQLIERFKQVEEENRDFLNRYLEIENENNSLANLYIASYQLHSTLDFKDVLRIIIEIIINLIGAEEFAILLLDEKSHELKAVATEGVDKQDIPLVSLGKGIIGNVARTGENYFNEDLTGRAASDMENPIVAIPMMIKERVIGVIVIYKLLQQKEKFTSLDHELFTLLAGHTATAIFSAKLYSESERKLSTIQGFIDLLTK